MKKFSKHILYVNPTAIHGGAEEVLLHFMEVSQDLGYYPILVVPHEGWLTQQCRIRNIPCELLPSLPNTFTTDFWQQQFRPWLLNGFAIAQLVRKWNAVMVHSNTPRTAYHGGLGARFAKVKAITHVHDIVNIPYSSSMKARLLHTLTDWTIVPSNAVAEALIDVAPQFQSRIQTLYNGWDISIYQNVVSANLQALFNIPEDALVIGSVSAMTPWKGQDILIDAFCVIYNQNPQSRLIIVGSSQGSLQQDLYEQQLHQQVHEAGLQNVVIFTGWREDVWSLIKSFDIFVHVPTKPDPLPTVVLHACALGSTIVASSIGGIPEMIIDDVTGVLVPPSNAKVLSDELLTLSDHADKRLKMKQSSQQYFLDKFSRQIMRNNLGKIYSKVLKF